ncbi:Gfo/Idh/MocA family oxidoreductase [Streptomyces sp. S3(2020)]|uniref:Gfo/Idh/MocA family protein n=1 Tax=Streptomyces sp. S3(2020) TaxID=2732044 RepID=UPI0014897EF2|nr:Gfo/Idh/MocA family oxidoreductase [Streptomyces sp. S3(2020)]NNN31392.1 Gfo/Idh/MocA family oxidoreductase [Streptomyces sp. S3(2020)]
MRTVGTRWGILGAGKIARVFAADLTAAGLQVSGVAARDPDRAARFAGETGIPASYGSYEELVLAPDVDAVYVATPQPFHADQAILAIEAGRAVLVEKSFADDALSAQRIVDAARHHSVFAMEAMWTRFLPTFAALRDELARGAVGELRGVVTHHFQKLDDSPAGRHYDPALGGGAVADLGVYGVSLAFHLLGAPHEIVAEGRATPSGVDTSASVLMRHGHGRTSTTLTAMDTPGPNGAAVIGTDGWIEIDPYWFGSTGFTVYDAGRPGSPVRRFEPPVMTGRGMHFQALEVERCLREGELESPLMPLSESVSVIKALDEIRRQVGTTKVSRPEPVGRRS